MEPSVQMVLVVLAALVAGLLIPVLIQVFLAARSLRRVVGTLETRLEPTFDEVTSTIQAVREMANPAHTLMSVGTALAPALFAAIKAFRGEAVPEEILGGGGNGVADGAPGVSHVQPGNVT